MIQTYRDRYGHKNGQRHRVMQTDKRQKGRRAETDMTEAQTPTDRKTQKDRKVDEQKPVWT